jgi:hypothetical protein
VRTKEEKKMLNSVESVYKLRINGWGGRKGFIHPWGGDKSLSGLDKI